MNVGHCYTSPAEYLANCSIPALGWKWSSDYEVMESEAGATLLWAGELRDILQQAHGLGLPNLRITLILAAALLRREVFQRAVPDDRAVRIEPLLELAREVQRHRLIRRLEQASPLPHQIGHFIQRVFHGLDVDGFFGGDARDVTALLDSQHVYRQLRRRLAGAPPSDPAWGTTFTDVQRVLQRLNELPADEIIDRWKTGHTHLETYDEVLTTLGRMILGYAQDPPAEAAATGPSLTPDEAMKEIARMEGGEVALRAARGLYPALHFPSLRSRAEASPLGGYSDITRRGSFDSILISQLAYDSDEFMRRFAENELLYYQHQSFPEIPAQPLICLIDMGLHMWGRPRLLAAGCALAAWKGAVLRQRSFELYQTFFGAATRLQPEQANRLAGLLSGIDDSETPAEALRRLYREQRQRTPTGDLLLITSPEAFRQEDLKGALRELQPGWRTFAITLDRREEMRFFQLPPVGAPHALSRVDFRCLVAPVEPAAAARPGDGEQLLPNLFRIGHLEAVTALTFTPDSSILFSGDNQGRICWWSPRRKTLDQEMVLPQPGFAVRDLSAGPTVLAVLAEKQPAPDEPPAGSRWWVYRYNLLSGGLIDSTPLPTPAEVRVDWLQLSPEQDELTVALPNQVLHLQYDSDRPATIDRIAVPGTPIACVRGRSWRCQYLLTEQRNLYRLDLAANGSTCRHLRPEPGAQIAVDRDGSILAVRGRDLVRYPPNPNRDSGPADETIVASLKDGGWQVCRGAWDGSLLLSSPRVNLFVPEESRHKPLALPLLTVQPWAVSPWGRMVAAGVQREIRVFHSRKGELTFHATGPRLQSAAMGMFFGPSGNELWLNYGAASGHHWQWHNSLSVRQTGGHPHPARSVSYSLVNSAVQRIEFYAGRTLVAMGRHRISVIGAARSWNTIDELVCCAVHPEESLLAVLDSRNIVWLLRAEDLRLVAALHASDNRFAAWNPSGQLLGDAGFLGQPATGADFTGFAAYLRQEGRGAERPEPAAAPPPSHSSLISALRLPPGGGMAETGGGGGG